MNLSHLPKNVPQLSLPGHSFYDPYKNKFNKQHLLDIRQGTQTCRLNRIQFIFKIINWS